MSIQNMDYPQAWQIQLSQRASVVVSQIQCHWILIEINDTYTQSINFYTIVVVATFV
jgi:hypothetical protein